MSHSSLRRAARGGSTEPKLRVAPYLRASKDRRRSAKSVTDQATDYEASLVAHVDAWTEVDRFVDNNRSASPYARRAREDFKRLCEAIAAGLIDVLWLWEFSRAQRRLKTYAELAELCRAHGVKWFIFTDGQLFDLDDRSTRQLFGFKALQAEGEAEDISDRSRRGVRANLAAKRPFGIPAYGYRRVYDPHTGVLVGQTIDAVRGPVVVEIADRYAAAEPVRAITADLNERGVPTPTDRAAKWYPKVVKEIATNPTYIGKRAYKGKQRKPDGTPYPSLMDGDWPAILTVEVHEQCLRRAALPHPNKKTRPANVLYLLSGWPMTCGKCGGKTSPENARRGGRLYERYKCRRGCLVVARADAERVVVAAVLAWLARPSVAAAVMSPNTTAALATARERTAAERAELADAKRLWKSGALSVAAYAEMEPELLARVERAEADERALVVPGPVANVLRSTGTARQRWDALELTAQREVLQSLWTIEVFPMGAGGKFRPELIRMTPR